MTRGEAAPPAPGAAGAAAGVATEAAGGHMPLRRALEHMIAVSYGTLYDGVVRGFAPWERLVDEIAALVARAVPPGREPREVRVLDAACGIGNVALRLAGLGYSVVGVDAVRHLVLIAREKSGPPSARLSFHHVDLARGPAPGAGSFDVVVSVHTLYWHPAPAAFLAGCRRALKPGGHGVFLTYGRPARVGRTYREVRAVEGRGAALRALRWLVPTAVFERLRDCEHRYLDREAFHAMLEAAGFEVLEGRRTFLAGLSHLAWARARDTNFDRPDGAGC